MQHILVSAFGAFGTFAENPSESILRSWTPDLPKGWDASKVVLPVSWERAFPALLAALTPTTRIVLCLGVAAARNRIEFERQACNKNGLAHADIDGITPHTAQIVPEGAPSLPSTLPVDALARALSRAGIPAGKSDNAGDFLCNHLSYALLHYLANRPAACLAGFIHVPPADKLSVAEGARALTVITREFLRDFGDGRVHPA